MTASLRAELIKLRTTRTFAVLAALAVGTSVLIAGLVAVLTEPTRETVLFDVFNSDTSSFFILVLAVIGISGEWRHRTISSSLLAAPDRRRFLAAKVVAFALAGLVLSLLVSIGVSAMGAAVLSIRELPLPAAGDLSEQVGRNGLVAMSLGAFGVAIGALVRNQVVAVVSLLALASVVEPLVVGLAPSVGRLGPLGAIPASMSGISAEDAGMDGVELLSMWAATLAMLAWIAWAFAVATVLLQRRDLE